jgi:hypothetical protein
MNTQPNNGGDVSGDALLASPLSIAGRKKYG